MRPGIQITAAIYFVAGFSGLALGDNVNSLMGPGNGGSIAYDINDAGQIVGESASGLSFQATLWDSNGVGSYLDTAAGYNGSIASAINNDGLIVGYSDNSTNGMRTAMFWDNGRANDLGADMRAVGNTFATDINDNGTIIGGGQLEFAPFGRGWVWSASEGGQVAGTLYQGGVNRAINNMEVIVGHSFFFGDPDNVTVSIPDGRGGYFTEDISPPGFNYSIATAVNNTGMIVGNSNFGTADGAWQAAIYTTDLSGPPGPPMLLGSLDGLNTSEAADVNDHGMIVGNSWDGTHSGLETRAWAWVDGVMYDLNDQLDENSQFALLVEATGVNNNGDIVGWGVLNNGTTSAFLIEGFVPAPGALGLLGLGGFTACRRRRSNA